MVEIDSVIAKVRESVYQASVIRAESLSAMKASMKVSMQGKMNTSMKTSMKVSVVDKLNTSKQTPFDDCYA